MKKNVIIRVAAILMILTVLSMCAISGTFAKYVTSGEASDSARVAKFGVTVDATSSKMFAKTYATNSGSSIANTVVAQENVVAPGTEGTLVDATLSGAPEVAVSVTYDATLELANWSIGDAEYCPLEITVEGTKYTCTGTISEFIKAVESAIESCEKTYEAGTNLSTKSADAPSVSWAWAFEDNDDAKDTVLGNATTPATIKLTMTTTVTQID